MSTKNDAYFTLILGARGKGKTTLMAAIASLEMIPPNSIEDLWKCEDEIEEMRAGGWTNLSLEPHIEHLVYVIDDVFTATDMGYPEATSMELKFERLGLYDGENEVDFVLPFAKIFIPEIQSKLDSRKSTTGESAPDYLLRFLERQRKKGIRMWADTQLYHSLDRRGRDFADRVIEVLDHTYTPQKATWYGLEFDNIRAYERWFTTGKTDEARKYKRVHNGDIRKCVNSFSGKEYHYHGMTGNYDARTAKLSGNNRVAMNERCEKFPLFKPKGEDK